jgi:hypothetical protein
MEINNFSPDYSITEQLIKYAKDLAKAYKTAKQNQKGFEAANQQLTKYANDPNKTLSETKIYISGPTGGLFGYNSSTCTSRRAQK